MVSGWWSVASGQWPVVSGWRRVSACGSHRYYLDEAWYEQRSVLGWEVGLDFLTMKFMEVMKES